MSQPSILVVEDNQVTRKVIRVALGAEGYRVREAERAQDAVRLFEEEKPGLVLTDLTLPDMDGFELFNRLRMLDPDTGVPVLAVSGRVDDGRARAMGFREYLMKPIEPGRLVRAVQVHLTRSRPSIGSRQGARVLVVGGDPVERELRCGSLRAQGFEVINVRTGFEAVAAAQRAKPDVIVSELVMPEFNGFHLCWAVRTDPSLRRVPVILMGERVGEEERAKALGAGASALLAGPYDIDALVNAIRNMIERSPAGPERDVSTAVPSGEEQRSQRTSMPGPPVQGDRLWKAMPSLLSVISELAEHPRGLERALDEILGVFLDASGFTAGSAFLESASGTLVMRAQVGHTDSTKAALGDFFGHTDVLASALRNGGPVRFTAPAATLEMRSVLAAAGMGSMLIVPLIFRQHRLGVFVLESPNSHVRSGWLEIAQGAAGPVAQAIVLARTVSEVSKSEHRFRAIAEAATDGVLVADEEGDIVYMNAAGTALFGGLPPPGRRQASVVLPFFDPEAGAIQEGDLLLPRGSVAVQVSFRDLHDPDLDVRRVYVVRDLSDKQKIAELSHLATRDPLTGLFNRRRFEEDLQARLAEADRYGTKGLLVLIDLDKFKPLNDTHGHLAGDAMLRAVAEVLRRVTRQSDVPARLGGDEFAVLLPHADPSHALVCAEKIRKSLSEHMVEFHGIKISIQASIGVAAFPDHGLAQTALFAAADAALYRAKRTGGNAVCVASSDSETPNGAKRKAQRGAKAKNAKGQKPVTASSEPILEKARLADTQEGAFDRSTVTPSGSQVQ